MFTLPQFESIVSDKKKGCFLMRMNFHRRLPLPEEVMGEYPLKKKMRKMMNLLWTNVLLFCLRESSPLLKAVIPEKAYFSLHT